MKSNYVTFSKAIQKNHQVNITLDGFLVYRESKSVRAFVGWGNKPNTQKAQSLAAQHNIPYIALEDGFIGYEGHPGCSSKTGKERLSFVVDHSGIYYNATKPSDLENYCIKLVKKASNQNGNAQKDILRAAQLIKRITELGISKYNHQREALPNKITQLNEKNVLLIDQTFNDQSVIDGGGSVGRFNQMLDDAIALSVVNQSKVILKTHPDVIKGLKKGYFDAQRLYSDQVVLLGEDVSIKELMGKVSDVFVMTSQMGFEALLYKKNVHCYGLPFYAGWGLTNDQQKCDRRNVTLSIEQLTFAALIQYPIYLHPVITPGDTKQRICQVEEIIDWLELQLSTAQNQVEVCYALGFSLWKRGFVKQFVARSAQTVVFVKNEQEFLSRLDKSKSTSLLLWGRGRKDWADSIKESLSKTQIWYMEDGFVRSVGLGADLRRPSCLVIDKQGMYYDPSAKSDVIDQLNGVQLTDDQSLLANELLRLIVAQKITKYNVGNRSESVSIKTKIRQLAQGRKVLLVPGQFENDLSIKSSQGSVKSNFALLEAAKVDFPNHLIVFKEHPDVYSGVRPGALGQKKALSVADLYIGDADMNDLIGLCDDVATITSLTGFEALMRNKQVTVYGSPFYAGWGLTFDKINFPDRLNNITLSELIYVCLVQYPRYVDWRTGKLCNASDVVKQLAADRKQTEAGLTSHWFARQFRKVSYLWDAFKL